MKWSIRAARTSGSAQVSRFMAWHHGHHQLCSDTITNFPWSAARWKVGSDQALQKPSLLSGGAAAAPEAKSVRAARKLQNRFIDLSAAGLGCTLRICRTRLSVVQLRSNTGSGGPMTVVVQGVTPSFAAEVGDVDLSKPLKPEDLAAIRAAFTKYGVLIFPDQHF